MRDPCSQRAHLSPLSQLPLPHLLCISVHNSGWPKGDWDLGVQCLLPYSWVQMLTYSFGGGGGKEMYAVLPELASYYKIALNFLKLSGRSIWGCTAFGRPCGGAGVTDPGFRALQGMGRDILPVHAYVLTVEEEGGGLCMGVLCNLSARGVLGCLEGTRTSGTVLLLSGLGSSI